MEYGLWRLLNILGRREPVVLILVLMEYGLWRAAEKQRQRESALS